MKAEPASLRAPAPTTPPSTPPSISRQSIYSLRSRYLQGLGYHNVKGAVRVGVEVFQLEGDGVPLAFGKQCAVCAHIVAPWPGRGVRILIPDSTP